MPPLPYPPSNLPKLDPESATAPGQSGKNGCGATGGGGAGPPGNVCCNNGCDYTVKYPNNGSNPTKLSWDAGTLLSDHGSHRVDGNNTNQDWTREFMNQWEEEAQHKREWDAKNAKRLGVRIWNPSDDPKDPTMSIAINNLTYGALTKLIIKPTIPFPISFSLTGAKAPKSEPPPPPPAELPSYSQHERNNQLTQDQINQNIESNRIERAKQARQGLPQDPLYVPPTTGEYMASNNH